MNSTRPGLWPDDRPAGERAEVNLCDIACALGISHEAVSRAFANCTKTSDETRSEERAVKESKGDVAPASARLLRGRGTSLVGLVIPDSQNDFFATIARLVTDTMAARSMQVMLSVTDDDPLREWRELRTLTELRPAGVIIVPSPALQPATEALLSNLCTVQLARKHPGLSGKAVLIDDRKGLYAATRHLIDYGHRRIAYVGSSTDLSTGRERLAGFQAALDERGIEAGPILLGAPRAEVARQAIMSIMSEKARPTALVLGSSELTLGALQALRALGLEWPRDISVVGYHDPAWFELAEHGITTVRLPVEEIALTATSLVLAALDAGSGDAGPDGRSGDVHFTSRLVLRSSTARLEDDGARLRG